MAVQKKRILVASKRIPDAKDIYGMQYETQIIIMRAVRGIE
jgi:hypothetical protein